ncbi:MAG: sulfite exporter TauE/SafE family protein, partial [Halobacteria archaeon]|nr:sulfite exporter TauE/SafE family protein [Halobacteria archaeon]
MCGPLVTMYSDRMAKNRERGEIQQHILFNLGRTASYAVIGATMGLLGAFVFEAATLSWSWVGNGIRGVVGIVVGGFILASGVRYLVGGDVVNIPGT